MKLLIVESPTKAKKIAGMLGSEWRVKASLGHIRDLPVHSMGVNLETFEIEYEFGDGKKKLVSELAAIVREASEVYLATDPDREGEAISWHLAQTLKLRNPYRVKFDQITNAAVTKAIASPGRIDENLVRAQEARRILDRLVGYRVSPAISDRIGQTLSAGRVQTPALRLVVERAREIANFVSRQHYSAELTFSGGWTATWDFSSLVPEGEKYWTDPAVADAAAAVRDLKVLSCEDGESMSAPPAPFKTSTLQQAASVSLKIDSDVTMKLAQKLFENGHITYHRTDDVNLCDEAIAEIRSWAGSHNLGVPSQPRRWKAAASAQEAHEGIRPTHFEVEDIDGTTEEKALYKLIRLRAIASQLADAKYAVRTATLQSKTSFVRDAAAQFVARGRTLIYPGWKALTASDAAEEDDESPVPNNPVPMLDAGTEVHAVEGRRLDKKTEPPGLYTEATLIKELEKRGIGRPATYASIMAVLTHRAYVSKDAKRRLSPTKLGETVVDSLVGRFAFADCGFTATLETELDHIASGKRTYLDLVRGMNKVLDNELAALANATIARIEKSGPKCPECKIGTLEQRPGKFGKYWSCDAYRSKGCKAHFPDKRGKPDFTPKTQIPADAPTCPKCGVGKLVQRQSKRGTFYGCTQFAAGKCDAMYNELPTAVAS